MSEGQYSDPMDVIMSNVSQDLGMAFGCTSIVAFGKATASGSLYHARNLDNISESIGRSMVMWWSMN